MMLMKCFYLVVALIRGIAVEARAVDRLVMQESLKITTRIVNGKRADEYESFGFSAGALLCGGTLIHDDIFLTAAHCKDVFLDGIILGGTTINGSDKRLQVSVDYEIPHPGYVDDTAQSNDIMLVKLSTRVTSLPFQPLAEVNTLPVTGDILTAIGYGTTTEGGDLSFNLLEVDLDVSDFGTCNTLYGDILTRDMQFCTYTETKDTCQGDSGGPLLNANGVQVGIISFGSGCARQGAPAVNIRVGDYASWIKAGICEHSEYEAVFCTSAPTQAPILVTSAPSNRPTRSPVTAALSTAPTSAQTVPPTTPQPSIVLTPNRPSVPPTSTPSEDAPNEILSPNPSQPPTLPPTATPSTAFQTKGPTHLPTSSPSPSPTESPIRSPTLAPSLRPTPLPSPLPTPAPSLRPTPTPSLRPTPAPSPRPTPPPTKPPVNPPSLRPTVRGTQSPSKAPSRGPRHRSFWSLIRWYFNFYFRSWFYNKK